eukprot:580990-Amphidinium_carterae.2
MQRPEQAPKSCQHTFHEKPPLCLKKYRNATVEVLLFQWHWSWKQFLEALVCAYACAIAWGGSVPNGHKGGAALNAERTSSAWQMILERMHHESLSTLFVLHSSPKLGKACLCGVWVFLG